MKKMGESRLAKVVCIVNVKRSGRCRPSESWNTRIVKMLNDNNSAKEITEKRKRVVGIGRRKGK